MGDPSGAHITRIYVNCPRLSPSPIRSSKSAPVCTSTPITPGAPSNTSPKEKMAQLAKEILASQRSSETFVQKPASPEPEQYMFVSKQTRQTIDFTNGDGLGKKNPTDKENLPKKKKKRQTIAVVPPMADAVRSSKSSDDGDNMVPLISDLQVANSNRKTSFTSYDGLQMFTFTLDDD